MAIPGALANINGMAALLGALSLLIVFFWPPKIAKYLPGPLAALIIGTLISVQFPGAPIIGRYSLRLARFDLARG